MDAMYGKLGEMALNLNAPYGFVYPSLLTVACGLDIEDRGGNVRGTLYTALLGGVNFGKSIVTQRAKKSIYTGEGTIEEGTLGSDRGLINDIGEDGNRKVFLQDELRNLLSKCAIQGSSLTPVLCKLWSSNIGAASDKRSKDICNGVVSILGNLAVEDCGDFAKIMGSETTRGLYDRMLFGIGPFVWCPAGAIPKCMSGLPKTDSNAVWARLLCVSHSSSLQSTATERLRRSPLTARSGWPTGSMPFAWCTALVRRRAKKRKPSRLSPGRCSSSLTSN
jgi:hypothetical protein